MRILILGVTGMFGSALYKVFASNSQHEVWATLLSPAAHRFFAGGDSTRLIDGVDVTDHDGLVAVMNRVRPDVVIYAVGVVKQRASANDPLIVLPINALFSDSPCCSTMCCA